MHRVVEYSVTACFPAAVAHRAFHSASVQAGSFPSAAARGLRQIMKRTGVKGKRHKEVRITVAKMGRNQR